MTKIKLTKTFVDKLPFAEKGKQVDYYDSELDGFGLRVSATSKKYFARRLIGKKRVRVMIGNHQVMTADKARSEAKIKLGVMESGVDPNHLERQEIKQAEEVKRLSVTLSKALDSYLEKRKLKEGTKSLYRTLFDLHLADWLKLPAAEITAAMVNQKHMDIANGKRQRPALDKTVTTGKRSITKSEPEKPKRREASADGVMRVLRAVLNYTFADDEEAGIVRVNPVRTLSRKKAWYKVDRRRTLIKNSELPAWHKAVIGLDNNVMKDYLLFLLFTGLRRQEAATLKWKQVDFEEGCFTIVDTKNKEPHTLPLSGYLHNLLHDRKEGLKTELAEAKAALTSIDDMTAKQQQTAINRVVLAESRLASQYVFPGEGATGYIVEPKRAIDAVTATTGINFSCHDLRRTFATIAESLDLSSYTVKALLNHKQQIGDVTGGYIILNVDRLREPMQKITNALLERIKTQHGQVVQLLARAE